VIASTDIKTSYPRLIEEHDLIISAHCKQLFPEPLVEARRCINIHPGLNPHNRGWYPQVFCILNGLPLGATIHEIDAQLDHGPIIDQMQVALYPWDTSLEAYNRVRQAEAVLLDRSIDKILDDTYVPRPPATEGNVNYRKDFNALCRLDLDERLTLGQAIDRLRALTHGSFENAYFIDPATNKKVFVRISLTPET
jgi:methionyl-tRNA formyltransferase